MPNKDSLNTIPHDLVIIRYKQLNFNRFVHCYDFSCELIEGRFDLLSTSLKI